MTQPFTGLPTDTEGCAHSAALDQPACGRPPAVHNAALDPGWGLVAFTTCETHSGIARDAAAGLAEHPYGPACDAGICWATADLDGAS